jgi:Domain of unknown function (DUF3806)
MSRSFEPLSGAEIRWVQEQLESAREFVSQYTAEDSGSPTSLVSLDRAFVSYLASESDPSEADAVVLAVGVAFGSKLVEELGFEWVIATDDYGTDLAVLAWPGRGDVTIFPTDFVAKRYERREAPFLKSAFAEIRQQLQKVAAEWRDAR